MEAHKAFKEEDIDGALVRYLLLAELGYEIAQCNAAYILDQSECFPEFLKLCGQLKCCLFKRILLDNSILTLVLSYTCTVLHVLWNDSHELNRSVS